MWSPPDPWQQLEVAQWRDDAGLQDGPTYLEKHVCHADEQKRSQFPHSLN
jgi:hypothetical protein